MPALGRATTFREGTGRAISPGAHMAGVLCWARPCRALTRNRYQAQQQPVARAAAARCSKAFESATEASVEWQFNRPLPGSKRTGPRKTRNRRSPLARQTARDQETGAREVLPQHTPLSPIRRHTGSFRSRECGLLAGGCSTGRGMRSPGSGAGTPSGHLGLVIEERRP